MITPRDVKDKLAKLEALGSPDAIAMELEARGIKAERMSATRCAIARYLGNSSSGSRPELAVCHDYVIVGHNQRMPSDRIATPKSVRLFISNFDAGEYPALDVRS